MSDAGVATAGVVADSLRLAAAAVSECGPVRADNQDAFRMVEVDGAGLGLVVADGMGGHAGGGEAAEAAIIAAASRLGDPAGSLDDLLSAAVADANSAVDGVRRRLGGSPGTTLVAAALTASNVRVANVGDSRAYLIRNGVAHQLTEDHSMVGEQVRAGVMDVAAARHDPRRNYITRALLGDAVDPDLTDTAVGPGDTLLLCSDGLWEPLEDDAIAAILSSEASIGEVSRQLVDRALEAGSKDNVTVICARVEES